MAILSIFNAFALVLLVIYVLVFRKKKGNDFMPYVIAGLIIALLMGS